MGPPAQGREGGRAGAQLGEEVVYAEPGDVIFKPRGQWHSFWNAGDEPARILEIISPAGREVVLLCSNDYLGLAGHHELRAAAAAAALTWGAGSGASPLVSGHMELHRELEEELAAFKRAEACVLFGSGYLANTGVVATLA